MGCGGFTCSKNALAALNVLYILVALILITVAAYSKAMAIITSISIMSGIIACGVFLLLIAFVGLIGAIKHHQVLLFFYMIILFLIFLVQFSVACACVAVNATQQQRIVQTGWRKSTWEVKSQVQQMYDGCCGFDDLSQDDVNETSPMSHPPCGNVERGDNLSCCLGNEQSVCCSGGGNSSSSDLSSPLSDSTVSCGCAPCWKMLHARVDQALKISGGIGLFFSFTEIFGVWMTVRYRNQKDPRANPSAFL